MIGNIDFQADSSFSIYAVALLGSGLILLLMALIGFGASTGSRVVSAIVGLAMLGYGVYLAFIFEGGEYWRFIYVFIVPVLLIISIFRSRKSKDEAPAS
jgi:phosphate/sulfate permease